jgi:hypothetical protein
MDNVRAVGGANYVESVAGYTGQGVRGEVMDNGCQTSHPDFAGRILVRRGPAALEFHGTATFGIVFGSGAGSSSARGMLPDGSGIFSMWAPGDRYTDSAALIAAPYNCVFQSNSWGAGFYSEGDYTTQSNELDRIVFDYDITILQGQGNYSDQTSLPEAWGKNIVSVGGVNHRDTGFLSDDAWSHDASTGPAQDGRIKPDLAYWYDYIRTTSTGSGYTDTMGGTSAATPETAGHFGLFFQMWSDGIFGNPVNPMGTVFSNRPHASTAKAVMINNAVPYSFSGLFADLTRTHQGWGLPNVRNAYDRRNNMLVVNETDVLTEFGRQTYARAISPGVPNHDILRVTLVYTDPAGTTSASKHLINDLTLKVTSPTGTVYWGNQGLLVGNVSTPGGAADTVNNVENVFINNPGQGIWTVEVSADDVNQDGHKETPQRDVDYALVVTGGDSCLYADIVTEPHDVFPCYGDDVVLEAEVADFISLQWYKDGEPLVGETGPSLSIPDFGPGDEANYQLGVTNECGERLSRVAVVAEAGAPTIVQQPLAPVTPRCAGDDLLLTVQAGGVGPFTYQWYHDGELIEGATTFTYLKSPAGLDAGGEYYCEVSNACAVTTTSTVFVQTAPTPAFTEHPQDACGEIGETVVLTAAASAAAPITYQWRKGSTVVGSGPTLTLVDLEPSDAGMYRVLAFTQSPICITFSETAEVTVGDCVVCETPGDLDGDGDFDLVDMSRFTLCFGELGALVPGCQCANVDDSDDDVDLNDWARMQLLLLGPQ